jgi:hypothetical protein
MDLSINKPMKDVMKTEFIKWYGGKVTEQMSKGTNANAVKVNLNKSVVKPLCAIWFMKAFQNVANNPHHVVTGFRKAGILDRLWPADTGTNVTETNVTETPEDQVEGPTDQ